MSDGLDIDRALSAVRAAAGAAGAGRKPKSVSGESMKTRQVRMTDQQWLDLKLVTADAMRAWVTKQARKLRGE